MDIIKCVLFYLICFVVYNVGVNGFVACEKVMFFKDSNFGYNVVIGEYEDFMKGGVFDLIKVICCFLENVCFVVKIFFIFDVVVCEISEDEEFVVGGSSMDNLGYGN